MSTLHKYAMNLFNRFLAIGMTSAPRGAISVKVSASTFSVTLAAGATVATIIDPYGSGSSYTSYGTLPPQFALSGSNIVATSTKATVGTAYTIGIVAITADGTRASGNLIRITAIA